MDKNTSISLHLTKVMGLENLQPLNRGDGSSFVLFRNARGNKEIFDPFTNRAQWADVVLWYVVAYKWAGMLFRPEETHNWKKEEAIELVAKPATSISADELDDLREKAGFYDWLKSHAQTIEWREKDEMAATKGRPTLDNDIRAAIARGRK